MVRQSFLIGSAFVFGCCVFAEGVSAQYYYDPGYYQPQMYAQPQMAYPGTMETYGQEPQPQFQRMVQEAPTPSRARRLSRTTNHSVIKSQEELPGIMVSQPAAAAVAPTEAAPAAGTAHASAPLPDVRDGALHILDIPGVEAQAHCCPDSTTGNCDKDLTRYETKQAAIDAGCDPECLVCVKEPFICTKIVMDSAEVVFFRCYERTIPFNDKRCEDQRCIQEVGERTVKKLEPCTVKINFPCKKTVIDYREVWICIKCKDNC